MQALEPPAADSELLQLQMALAQVYLQQEKLSACCGQLRHLDPVSRPGVLGSMVSLYEGEEDIDSAVQLLQDAGTHAAKGELSARWLPREVDRLVCHMTSQTCACVCLYHSWKSHHLLFIFSFSKTKMFCLKASE